MHKASYELLSRILSAFPQRARATIFLLSAAEEEDPNADHYFWISRLKIGSPCNSQRNRSFSVRLMLLRNNDFRKYTLRGFLQIQFSHI